MWPSLPVYWPALARAARCWSSKTASGKALSWCPSTSCISQTEQRLLRITGRTALALFGRPTRRLSVGSELRLLLDGHRTVRCDLHLAALSTQPLSTNRGDQPAAGRDREQKKQRRDDEPGHDEDHDQRDEYEWKGALPEARARGAAPRGMSGVLVVGAVGHGPVSSSSTSPAPGLGYRVRCMVADNADGSSDRTGSVHNASSSTAASASWPSAGAAASYRDAPRLLGASPVHGRYRSRSTLIVRCSVPTSRTTTSFIPRFSIRIRSRGSSS